MAHITDIVADTEKKPVLSFHEWADLTSREEKSIIIRASELQAKDTLYIGVHGAGHEVDSKFKLTLRPASTTNSNHMEVDTNTEDSVECENCGSWVPQRTLPLHERFCFRNNVRCPWGCGAVFKKGSEELENHWHCDKCDYCGVVADKPKHQSYFHQERECVCGEFKCDSLTALSKHRRTECYQKLIICRFCRVSIAPNIMFVLKELALTDLLILESCSARRCTEYRSRQAFGASRAWKLLWLTNDWMSKMS